MQVWNYINKLNVSKKHKELLYQALGYTIAQPKQTKATKSGMFKTY